MTIILTPDEVEILFRQDSDTKHEGGWQNLLVALQQLTNEQTLEITIPPIILERIGRYAFQYGNGGWEGRLRSIFGRTLGPQLDGNI